MIAAILLLPAPFAVLAQRGDVLRESRPPNNRITADPLQPDDSVVAVPLAPPDQPGDAGDPSEIMVPNPLQDPDSPSAPGGRGQAQSQGQQQGQQQRGAWLPMGTATLQALDKVNARGETLVVKVGDSGHFGSLNIAVRGCFVRAPDSPTDATAYLVIRDQRADAPSFSGWVVRSAPYMSMLAHPMYQRSNRRLLAMSEFATTDALPPFRSASLLLDMDGTLLDLAPTPDAVIVPPGLTDTLRALRGQLGDALAIVTGRAIATIDALFGDVPFAVAGEHGGAVRPHPGAAIERPEGSAPPRHWLDVGAALEAAYPGAMFEQKPRGFGLHFRLAPDAGPEIHQALFELVADSPAFELLQGHMMWEIRPRGVDKGGAVTQLMRNAPFHGRAPVFIGDDVTDEAGMRVARAMGGTGLWVPEVFGDAAGVRAWLHATASLGDWALIHRNRPG